MLQILQVIFCLTFLLFRFVAKYHESYSILSRLLDTPYDASHENRSVRRVSVRSWREFTRRRRPLPGRAHGVAIMKLKYLFKLAKKLNRTPGAMLFCTRSGTLFAVLLAFPCLPCRVRVCFLSKYPAFSPLSADVRRARQTS